MIKKINHKECDIALSIYNTFQRSYAIEAQLLHAEDFPPLKRTDSDIKDSNTVFFGYYLDTTLAAVLEINSKKENIHIQSLVVEPSFFKKGIASSMMQYVINLNESNEIMVETGAGNIPAINLYKKFGFQEVKQWDTDHGVRKTRLIKQCFSR